MADTITVPHFTAGQTLTAATMNDAFENVRSASVGELLHDYVAGIPRMPEGVDDEWIALYGRWHERSLETARAAIRELLADEGAGKAQLQRHLELMAIALVTVHMTA